jgi:XTP/dITP diphosphohydrolase
MQLLIATRNAHKTREFAEILGGEFEISDLSSLPDVPEVVETGCTFEENAILKALAVSQLRQPSRAEDRHLLIVADDSGLEVDALKAAPGIYSARYAGENASDSRNVEKLLGELTRQRGAKRTARFRCVIALARDGKVLRTFEGVAEGLIVDLPRGKSGFGYDPIFVPNGFEQTFAQLPAETKNKISHRAKAARELARYLKSAALLDQK